MSDAQRSIRFEVNVVLAALVEDALGYRFKNLKLLEQALTHSSAKTEHHPSNERMEFFGDAVLGLVVTEIIYHEFPEFPEGEMTRIKSVLVSRETLAVKAREMQLNRYLIMGKGVGSRDNLPRSILANVFEALVAAMYIEGGYEPCRTFLAKCFKHDINVIVTQQATRNYKSALQQLVQAHMGLTPTYVVVSESGPDHHKRFEVAAMIGERRHDPGVGSSKKEAEQTAALIALKYVLSELDLGEDEPMVLELPDDDDPDE